MTHAPWLAIAQPLAIASMDMHSDPISSGPPSLATSREDLDPRSDDEAPTEHAGRDELADTGDGKPAGRMVGPGRRLPWDGQGHLAIQTMRDGEKLVDAYYHAGPVEHAFGLFVARIQLQRQPGHWSAFWITGPVCTVGDGGRTAPDICIMEKPWLDDRVQHTFHWDGYGQDHKTEGKIALCPGVTNGFHTFGLWWTPEEYVFFVDGRADLAQPGGRRMPGSQVHPVERRGRAVGATSPG